MKLNYIQKLEIIRPFVSLNIRKKKSGNLTSTEKRLITFYYNKINNEGFIARENYNVFQTVKFVKTKKKRGKFKGYFVRGAKPSDKINSKGQIDTGSTLKTFIPIDFKKAYAKNLSDKKLENLITKALEGFEKPILSADYFSLVTANGYEIGRGQFKNFRDKKAKIIAKDTPLKNKIKELTREISIYLNRSIQNYKIAENLLSGVYLWKFKKQRKPNKTEFKLIYSKRKK